MRSEHSLWKDYLLFTILKRTIQKSEHVEEVASMLNCHPSSYIRRGKFGNENSDEIIVSDIQDGAEKITERLAKDIPDPIAREMLLADFHRMDADHHKVVEKFMTDAFFCDAILSFCGFASTIRLHTKEAPAYPINTLLSAFNDRALDFFCIQLELQDVICFLDICNNLGLNNDSIYTPEFNGWTYYLATWAVIRGQCSFWNFE